MSFMPGLENLTLNLTQQPISGATASTGAVSTGPFQVGRGSRMGDIPGPESVNSAGVEIEDQGMVIIAAVVLGAAIFINIMRRK